MIRHAPHLDDLNHPLVVTYESNFETSSQAQFYRDTLISTGWEYQFVGNGETWTGFIGRLKTYITSLRLLNPNKNSSDDGCT